MNNITDKFEVGKVYRAPWDKTWLCKVISRTPSSIKVAIKSKRSPSWGPKEEQVTLRINKTKSLEQDGEVAKGYDWEFWASEALNSKAKNAKFKVGDVVTLKDFPNLGKCKVVQWQGRFNPSYADIYAVKPLKGGATTPEKEKNLVLVNSLRSSNPVVANALERNSNVYKNFSIGDKVKVADSDIRYGGEKGEIVGKDGYKWKVRLLGRSDKPIVELQPNQVTRNARIDIKKDAVKNSYDPRWQFIVGKTYTDVTGRAKIKVTNRTNNALEYETIGGGMYGWAKIGKNWECEEVEINIFLYRADGKKG